jgi:hypothetical protein
LILNARDELLLVNEGERSETELTNKTMAQNFKNQLQELFQRNGLGLPKYTWAKSDDDKWISTVELSTGHKFSGKEAKAKVDSDLDAAAQAIKYYRGHLAEFETDGLLDGVLAQTAWFGIDRPDQIWIVIDLENVGDERQLKKLQQLTERGFIVSGYASSNYRNADKAKKYFNEQLLHISESDLSETADMQIVIDITQSIKEDDFRLIYIITFDRFARAAAEIFNKDFEGVRVDHCRTVDQVLMLLKNKN